MSNVLDQSSVIPGGPISGTFTGDLLTDAYLSKSALANDITLELEDFTYDSDTGVWTGNAPNPVQTGPYGVILVGSGVPPDTYYSGPIEVVLASATSPWFAFQKFLDRYGLENVTRASNKQKTSTSPNVSAIQDAFDDAKEDIEIFYSGSRLAVPFTFEANGGVAPKKLANWCMLVAYGLLYFSRGIDDKDKQGNRLQKLLDAAWREMSYYREIGNLPIDSAAASSGDPSSGEVGIVNERDVVRDSSNSANNTFGSPYFPFEIR